MRKLLQDWPLSKEEQKKRIMRLYDKDDQQQKGNNMERMIGSDSNEQNTAYQTLHDTHGWALKSTHQLLCWSNFAAILNLCPFACLNENRSGCPSCKWDHPFDWRSCTEAGYQGKSTASAGFRCNDGHLGCVWLCRRCCSRSSKRRVRRKRNLQSFVMTEAIQSRRCHRWCHKTSTVATLLKGQLTRDGKGNQYSTIPWYLLRFVKNSASLRSFEVLSYFCWEPWVKKCARSVLARQP